MVNAQGTADHLSIFVVIGVASWTQIHADSGAARVLPKKERCTNPA
jgi:hypothetical protein